MIVIVVGIAFSSTSLRQAALGLGLEGVSATGPELARHGRAALRYGRMPTPRVRSSTRRAESVRDGRRPKMPPARSRAACGSASSRRGRGRARAGALHIANRDVLIMRSEILRDAPGVQPASGSTAACAAAAAAAATTTRCRSG